MANKRSFLYIGIVVFIISCSIVFIKGFKNEEEVGLEAFTALNANNGQRLSVNAEDFGAKGDDDKDDSKALQNAINYSFKEKIGKVVLGGNQTFILRKGIILKEGVELELGHNTKLQVDGDFRVFDVEKNASIENGIFEIVNKKFESEVIYLDGEHKFWSWERTHITNVSIINSTGKHQGTGLYLHASGAGEFISFVNFVDLNLVGLHTGIKMQAEKPSDSTQYNFINGNRFSNLTLDDCVRYIEMDSSITIPNEISGNMFNGLQIQLSPISERALTVTGSDNSFVGMIWDTHVLKNNRAVIYFTKDSMRSSINSNLESEYISDKGSNNSYSSTIEEER